MASFSTLFEVRFFQHFFNGYTLRDLEIFPSPETLGWCKGLQLLYRTTPEGLVVLFNEDKKAILETLREPVALTFGIRSVNRHFETYSRIRPINKRTRYLIDNTGPQADGRIHPGEWLEESDAQEFFPELTDPRVSTGDAALAVRKGDRPYLEGASSWTVDDPTGWYDLTPSSGEAARRAYRLPEVFRQAWAVLDVWVGGPGATSFSRVSGSRYQIRIDRRPVHWHYYFVGEPAALPTRIEVLSGKESMPFSEPEKLQLVNGQWAVRVMSLNSYPLTSRPEDFTVSANLSGFPREGSEGLIKSLSLPVPEASRIKGKATAAGEMYFWESYIYL